MYPPRAAIVDLVLPDGDGVEVTRRLREWSEMPILVLSAIGDEEQKVKALEAGADDYITKPFGARELVARLQAALRRSEGARGEEQPVVVVDGLEVDLAARAVRRDGEPIHLTPIEFELLRVLVRNRGRLLTHRALLSEVWGPGYADDVQALRTHIARLRGKIEPQGPGVRPRYIVTDPGVGFIFPLSCAPSARHASLRLPTLVRSRRQVGRGVAAPSPYARPASRLVTPFFSPP